MIFVDEVPRAPNGKADYKQAKRYALGSPGRRNLDITRKCGHPRPRWARCDHTSPTWRVIDGLADSFRRHGRLLPLGLRWRVCSLSPRCSHQKPGRRKWAQQQGRSTASSRRRVDRVGSGRARRRGSGPAWRQQMYVATLASKGAGVAGFRSACRPAASGWIRARAHQPAAPGQATNSAPERRAVTAGRWGQSIRSTSPKLTGFAAPAWLARCAISAQSIRPRAGSDGLRVGMAEWATASPGCARPPSDCIGLANVAPACCCDCSTRRRRAQRRQNRRSKFESNTLLRGSQVSCVSSASSIRTGRFIARTDFAIPELKIAIEAHSRRFHFGPIVSTTTRRVKDALQAEGWIVRYVTHAQVAIGTLSCVLAARTGECPTCRVNRKCGHRRPRGRQ